MKNAEEIPTWKSFRVELERADRTAIVRVHRPHARNAIDRATMEELDSVRSFLSDQEDLGCVILTGEGDRAFIAGGDLKDLSHLDTPAAGQEMSKRMQGILNRWAALPFPSIAAIGANAYGGGCEIALACDLRVMSKSAHLVFSQARLGLLTGWGGSLRLVNAVGVSRALQILMTGQYLSADRAAQMGLVADVAPDGFALAHALDLARQITRHPPGAIEALKSAVYAAVEGDAAHALCVENEWFGKRWNSPEHVRAVQQFLGRTSSGGDVGKSGPIEGEGNKNG